ncbi:MAG TPA: DUF5335 family protein [Acidimicrobiia bacterium]
MSPDRHEPQRQDWREFFDMVTKDHEGDAVTVEIVDAEYGDQFEAEKLPFAYLEYDDKDDAVNVGVGGTNGRFPVVLRHTIEHPKAIMADPLEPQTARAFEIVDSDGRSTIVTLHPRPALPPPD